MKIFNATSEKILYAIVSPSDIFPELCYSPKYFKYILQQLHFVPKKNMFTTPSMSENITSNLMHKLKHKLSGCLYTVGVFSQNNNLAHSLLWLWFKVQVHMYIEYSIFQ